MDRNDPAYLGQRDYTRRKAAAISNVAAVLEADGVLFGGSILGPSGTHSRAARGFLRAFNAQGGFDNVEDTEDVLREMLAASFERVEVETVGSAALFAATHPRRPASADTGQPEPVPAD